MNQEQINLLEHQQPSSSSSRNKNKLYFILFLMILFTIIILSIITVFTALKHSIESQYPAITNSDNLVKEICQVVPYNHHCIESLWFLHSHTGHTEDIRSTDVLTLSISSAYYNLGSTYKNSTGVEKELAYCQGYLEGSLERLNKSLIMISEYPFETEKDKQFFHNYYEVVTITSAMDLIVEARDNLQRCINGLDGMNVSTKWNDDKKSFELGVRKAKAYVLNALAMLDNKGSLDKILFKPTVLSIFASLMFGPDNYSVLLVFFCSQYLLLMLLFCVLLRVFRSKNR